MIKLWELKRTQFYIGVSVIWLLLWIIYDFLNHPRNFESYILNDLWHAGYLVFINYVFFEYSLPFIRKKRPSIFYNILIGIFITGIQLYLISFGLYGWTYIGIRLNIYTTLRHSFIIPGGFFQILLDKVFYLAQAGISSTIFFGVANLFYNNIKLKLITQQQHIQMRETELNYLKSQTNPHFLFNTLNNIYGLASEKSDIAPESILRLSKILRFMLYETGSKFITIQQELDIIRDYIALEKLRYDDSLNINFVSEVQDTRLQLPPLLLIPLVENAFKHGISEDVGKSFIDINLCVTANQLVLTVKNSSEEFNSASLSENIGLSNLRRQLKLLYTDYDLSVIQDNGMFTASLKINLTSVVYDKVHHNRG